jgi:hypothetical protein
VTALTLSGFPLLIPLNHARATCPAFFGGQRSTPADPRSDEFRPTRPSSGSAHGSETITSATTTTRASPILNQIVKPLSRPAGSSANAPEPPTKLQDIHPKDHQPTTGRTTEAKRSTASDSSRRGVAAAAGGAPAMG